VSEAPAAPPVPGAPAAPPPPRDRQRHPARGYALVVAGAAMWGLNASLARFLLDDGVDALRLSQLRSAGSWVLLVLLLGVWRRDLLRVRRQDIPALAFLGIAGLALVHAAYFLAIERLQIGVAVTIQYLAPLLVLVWLRLVHGRALARGLWGAVALSLVGCFLVVRAYDAGSLDAVGVLAAFAATITFALYMVSSERAGHRHEAVTTLVWAFGFATLFWAVVQPWWTFPVGNFDSARNVLLGLGVVVVGTLLPFVCVVAGLRHVPAARAGVVATLEPVLAAVFAWVIHDEQLAAVQIVGGLAVLAAIVWVQSHRPDLEEESAPASRRSRVDNRYPTEA
jgi:drug/metabolite transporter (DMT)-like permease